MALATSLGTGSNVNGGTTGLEVGDAVDVPGGMHGTVKFIGSVNGKNGVFAGVELSSEFAQRGKNDGDVDGVQYFTTSIARSGIFLPIARATKRASPTSPSASYPLSPSTPSIMGNVHAKGQQSTAHQGHSPTTATVPHLSQSVGPGRATSPVFQRRARPSLPRPESPVRRPQNTLSTPVAGRPSLGRGTVSRTVGGGGSRPTNYAPSPSPAPARFSTTGLNGKRNSNSYAGDPGKRYGVAATPEPKPVGGGRRAQSALGNHRPAREVESAETARIGLAHTSNTSQQQHPTSVAETKAQGTLSGHGDEDIAGLKAKLQERDKQLMEQAVSLAEMESSLAELQTLIPTNRPEGPIRSQSGRYSSDGADERQLRAWLREKTDKIARLTAEFDAHRADFRNTIDTLELASAETERVYQNRVDELCQEIRELRERSADVESVALQLKQLEELVQELEEGLEDARRGEAEARGEVEFLRGEVERGRSELRREREKAAASALNRAGAAINEGGGSNTTSLDGAKEVEQRDDEIRGLKAIIHSLSRDSVSAHDPTTAGVNQDGHQVNGQATNRRLSQQVNEERAAREQLERETNQLRGRLRKKTHRTNELERELYRLRKDLLGEIPPESELLGPSGELLMQNGPFDPASPAEDLDDDDFHQFSQQPCSICSEKGHEPSSCPHNNNNKKDELPSPEEELEPADSRDPEETPLAITPGVPLSSFPPLTLRPIASLGLQRQGRDVVLEGLKRLSLPPSPHTEAHHVAKNTNNNNDTAPRRQPTALQTTSSAPFRQQSPQPQPRQPATPASAGGDGDGSGSDPTPEQHEYRRQVAAGRSPDHVEMGQVAGKSGRAINPDKWCALCEADGHECTDCPFVEDWH
ncbi:MAG: hypothetical protein M1816_002096 [Peltula sp. TS41687]|nr:MAG: hypothetical protein M1816_002096 [Peltula sp. TS41687]